MMVMVVAMVAALFLFLRGCFWVCPSGATSASGVQMWWLYV